MSSVSPLAPDVHSLARNAGQPLEGEAPAGRGSAAIWPGIVLVVMIAGCAFSARNLPGLTAFSPMILAVVVGMIFSNVVGTPTNTKVGIVFSQRRLLRLAIVLLGFQLTLGLVASIGLAGIGIVVLALVSTFLFTVTVGRVIGVDRKLAELLAVGTSICGASAIVATNALTDARDEDVAYAVASITLFGTIAMLVYPVLSPVLGLDQQAFGYGRVPPFTRWRRSSVPAFRTERRPVKQQPSPSSQEWRCWRLRLSRSAFSHVAMSRATRA